LTRCGLPRQAACSRTNLGMRTPRELPNSDDLRFHDDSVIHCSTLPGQSSVVKEVEVTDQLCPGNAATRDAQTRQGQAWSHLGWPGETSRPMPSQSPACLPAFWADLLRRDRVDGLAACFFPACRHWHSACGFWPTCRRHVRPPVRQGSPIGELTTRSRIAFPTCHHRRRRPYAQGGQIELGWLAACIALFIAYVRAQGKAAGAHQEFCGPMANPSAWPCDRRGGLLCDLPRVMAADPHDCRPGLAGARLMVIIVGGL